MSERKVLNKYYPPDFDPSKIPKLKGAKLSTNKQWTIRIMAPFNMRCNTCGEYIYKGKKFNSKKETVEDENYLGLHIFRFYIKCPRCVAEIAFKTDPQSTDYSLEAGATRNFEAAKTAEKMAEKEAAAIEEDEANNPMKVLENRTKQSMQEMEMIETLEELKEMNTRHARVDFNTMLVKHKIYEEQLAKLQDEEDDKFVSSLFGKNSDMVVKRLNDDNEDDSERPVKRLAKGTSATDILTGSITAAAGSSKSNVPLTGLVKPKSSLSGLVKPKSSLSGLVKPKSSLSGLVKPKSAEFVKPKNPISGFVKPNNSAGDIKPKTPTETFVRPKDSFTAFVKPTNPIGGFVKPKSSPVSKAADEGKKDTEERTAIKPEKDNIINRHVQNESNAEKETPKLMEMVKKEETVVKSKPVSVLGLVGDYSDSEESE